MTRKSPSEPPALPRMTDRALAEKEARVARAAAALRANLLRRKQQARARTEGATAADPSAAGDGPPPHEI